MTWELGILIVIFWIAVGYALGLFTGHYVKEFVANVRHKINKMTED